MYVIIKIKRVHSSAGESYSLTYISQQKKSWPWDHDAWLGMRGSQGYRCSCVQHIILTLTLTIQSDGHVLPEGIYHRQVRRARENDRNGDTRTCQVSPHHLNLF